MIDWRSSGALIWGMALCAVASVGCANSALGLPGADGGMAADGAALQMEMTMPPDASTSWDSGVAADLASLNTGMDLSTILCPGPGTCDVNLSRTGNDAIAFANSMDVCGTPLQAVGPPSSKQGALVDHFGSHWKPQSGQTMVLLSTGIAADEQAAGFKPVQPGTAFGLTRNNPVPVTFKNPCSGANQLAPAVVNDLAVLTMVLKVPSTATGIRFRLNYFSSESQAYLGGQSNDMFVARLTSKQHGACTRDSDCMTGNPDVDNRGVACALPVGACMRNVTIDASGQPITTTSDLFRVCQSVNQCGAAQKCSMPVSLLNGTGYEALDQNGVQSGGATGWLATTAPVMPGETIELTLFVYDAGDDLGDSAVLLDGFEWVCGPVTLETKAL